VRRDAFPYRLNTGRIRDQWHGMARSGRSPRLAVHRPEPFVEIHPEDAAAARVAEGGFARVSTQYGNCVLKVVTNHGQRRGSLFAPIHWSAETSSCARIGDSVASYTDPYSGQPESKATPAAIVPVAFAYRGFVMARRAIALPHPNWWARTTIAGGYGYLLATNDDSAAWRKTARGLSGENAEWCEYADAPRGIYRAAAFLEGRLDICLFIDPADAAPKWDSVKALFAAESLAAQQRRLLLSGRDVDGIADTGPVICACFGVGLAAIREAIASRRASNVEEIGKALRAGTNCGSCVPELKGILTRKGNADCAAPPRNGQPPICSRDAGPD
jgi:assimilatory nitrate reductase catalytic subunit